MEKITHNKTSDLVIFLILANVISWIFRIPLGLFENGVITMQFPRYFQFLGDWGPGIAAIIVLGRRGGLKGINQLITKLMPTKKQIPWLIIALFASPIIFICSNFINHNLLGGANADFSLVGIWEELPISNVFLSWLFLFLHIGVGEELGWRGYLQDFLEKRFNPLMTTLIIGFFWAFWHFPMFFFDEYFVFLTENPMALFNWISFVFSMAIIHGWFYKKAKYTLLTPIILHTSIDWIIGSEAATPMIQTFMGVIFFITSIVMGILLYKEGKK